MPGSPRRRTSTPILALGAVVLSAVFAFSLASAASLGVTSQQLTVGEGGTPPSPPPAGDTTPPTVTSVATAASPTGRTYAADEGATVTVTFSEAMAGSSICPGFTTGAATALVDATIANGSGATTDKLSLTAGGCSFGVLDLDHNGFVTATVTYSSSALAWNGSNELILTLGVASAPASISTHNGNRDTSFAPASALTDIAGNAIQPGPYTTPGKVFE